MRHHAFLHYDDYRKHFSSDIRPTLFWEYDLSRFDWAKTRNMVVQRMLERGFMADGKPLQWKCIEKRLLMKDRYPEKVLTAK